MKHIKEGSKPSIGIYTIGLHHYWNQFSGLKERITGYGQFIERKMAGFGTADVFNFGLVDTAEAGKLAGGYFNEHHVDLIFCHAGTYVTSACVLPVHQECNAPVVVLNLQPASRINYEKTTTGEWLAHCGACVIPEISNAFNRSGIPFRMVSGLLGLSETPDISLTDEVTKNRPEAIRAWREIEEWILAASVKRGLMGARFGYLGNTYSGMLDLYSDFTMLQAQTGIHVEVLEMCDLERQMRLVTEQEEEEKKKEIYQMFEISEDSASDPIARKPDEGQLMWSAKVAAAQERLVKEFGLDGLAYYYHGSEGGYYEKIQGGFIVGNSLLTAKGIPCAGEGDIKTALAMKICDMLKVGGSFCEIVVTDYEDGTILLGHDGPFHLDIAKGKPILRGMGMYHGKQGTGVSVEAKVKTGEITTLNVTQTGDGKLKFISSEAMSTAGTIMAIGNTQTPVKFSKDPDSYMKQWFMEAPTHHFAMSLGHNAGLFDKVADLMKINHVILK
ncbi:MAG: L-fucose/L-arabinose isomerase family protein [Hungatella sp.]|jgi:L-arabinose isomerase|nr:L-fucose/L-arabinose isomerase family protein [Hungatella sp.]